MKIMSKRNIPKRVPKVVFKTRVPDQNNGQATNVCEAGAFNWRDRTTEEIFSGRKVVMFALPGAFTPTCSSTHLPGYEQHFNDFQKLGVDEVICLAVNDAFVMNSWAKELETKNITMLPDGNADFTRSMDMLVKKEDLGFGERSWRYSMYVEDGEIIKIFIEQGFTDNCPDDPFEVSDAETMLAFLTDYTAPTKPIST